MFGPVGGSSNANFTTSSNDNSFSVTVFSRPLTMIFSSCPCSCSCSLTLVSLCVYVYVGNQGYLRTGRRRLATPEPGRSRRFHLPLALLYRRRRYAVTSSACRR